MIDNTTKPPTDFYLTLVRRMLQYDFPGCVELRAQIDHIQPVSTLETEDDGSGMIEIKVTDGPTAKVESRLAVEVAAPDTDSVAISALLFVDDGKLHLLDIYKDDSTPIHQMPPVEEFKLAVWDQVDEFTKVRHVD